MVFYPAQFGSGGNVPTLLEISGIDHIKERIYFRSQALPWTERGLNYLTFDGPGQGEVLVRGEPLRPDQEVAGRAAIDYLTRRPDVDPGRIGVFGTSFGSYFALRTAAGDERVKMLACRSTVYDALEDAYDFCPWICAHLQLLVDAPTPAEARTKLRKFTLKEVASKIRCPVFVTHGAQDDITSVAAVHKLRDDLPEEGTKIWIVEGARHFPGAENQLAQIDWMAAGLGSSKNR